MEEISYLGFFRFLLAQKMRILVLETGIILNDNIDILISNDEQGFVKKKNTKSISIQVYLQRLCEENDFKNKIQHNRNDKICYFYKKGQRKLLDDNKVKELFSKPKLTIAAVDMIQKYQCGLNEDEKIIKVKLSYINYEYHAEFYIGKYKLIDPIAMNSILDTITIIMMHLEQVETKRVIYLEIEYIKDRENNYWLISANNCKLIEAKYTINHPITSKYDIDQLERTIGKDLKMPPLAKKKNSKINKYYEIKPRPIEAKKPEYIFKRGQLRNNQSNLDSPIRIISPNIDDEENEEKGETSLQNNDPKKNVSNPIPIYSQTPKAPTHQCTIDNSEKSGFLDCLKYFISYKISPNDNSLDLSSGIRSPVDSRKTIYKRITTHRGSFRSLTKPAKDHKKQPAYENDFIELVLKTHFKNTPYKYKYIPDEFGMTTHVSSEEFTYFLSTIDNPKDEIFKNRLKPKPIIEESFNSRVSSSHETFPSKKKFEMQFMRNILAKKTVIFQNMPKPKPQAQTSRNQRSVLNLLINSPRSKLKPLESTKN